MYTDTWANDTYIPSIASQFPSNQAARLYEPPNQREKGDCGCGGSLSTAVKLGAALAVGFVIARMMR